MVVNFVGNFQRGYVGERADEVMLADEIENLGHTVRRVPRDEWREYVRDGKPYKNVPQDLRADINLFAKWHHFYDGGFIDRLREKSQAPVFYWCWDYMHDGTGSFPEWHLKAVQASDRYLSNDSRLADLYVASGVPRQKLYYFPFDVSSKEFDRVEANEKKYDVLFTGSYFPKGDRVEWLTQINKIYPIKIFSWNYEKWRESGFDAEQAIYGQDFARAVAESKIVLQFSVNDHCWGYWSNRVGKVLTVGGFLLARYAPGMELFLRDGAEYFSSPTEAIEKIGYYLEHPLERETIAERGYQIGRDRFTSQARVRELMIYVDRYLKGAF